MKYTIELEFIDKPICTRCKLSFCKLGFSGESEYYCSFLNGACCPEEGYRKDCPLKEVK